MCALIAAHAFPHFREGWVVVAVWADRCTLPFQPSGPQHQLKLIQGASQFLEKFDASVLRKAVGLVAMSTMEASWLGIDVLHVPVTFAASRQRLPRVFKRSE